jgi:hypothetical protein
MRANSNSKITLLLETYMYATKICQQLTACADKLGTGDGGNESLVWFGHGHLTRLNLEQTCTGLL